MLDIIIQGGQIIDGTGAKANRADLGVAGDRIAIIGDLGGRKAARRIDAAGRYVTPGFIDLHSHSDASVLSAPRMESKVMQGVTLEVTGNCGESAAPLGGEAVEDMERDLARQEGGLSCDWRSVGEYLSKVEARGIATNYATLAGHGTLRAGAVGHEMRAPKAAELDAMKGLLREALEEGAFGLSSGLIYPPSSYADTGELVALASVAAPYGGFYASHIRNEGARLLEAVAEALEIGELAGVPVQLSHHKASGRGNWGKVRESLAMIEEARGRGRDVTADQYPYIASSTGLSTVLPDWVHEGGTGALVGRLRDGAMRERIRAEIAGSGPGWENPAMNNRWESIVIAFCGSDPSLEGKSVSEIAQAAGEDPFDAAARLLVDNEGSVQVVMFSMCEEDVATVMRKAFVCVGSDSTARAPSGPMSGGKPHPRCYGTFPRVLGRYVRELGVLGWEEAVRKMTGLSASRLGLTDRGRLAEGAFADIVVFDPARVRDVATFADPHRFPEGIDAVIVNGTIAVEAGLHSGALAGRVLRRGRPSQHV
ncbi:MAG: D-aminoacylase [Spirochaetaceae bacterium]|nr:D-aminoacylase [Spirochaetaceae bacterium]